MKFELTESKNDIFSKLRTDFGFSNTPILGPSYILDDGSFLKIPTPEQLGVAGLVRYKCHALVNMWLVYKKYVKGYTIWDMNIMHIMEDMGAIRTNFGSNPDEEAKLNYIVLPKEKPKSAQLFALEDMLNYAYENGVKTVEININYSNYTRIYNLDETFTEEVMNKIRNFYATGKLA